MPQGVPWEKEKVVEILKPYFLLGYKINKACKLAKFSRDTFQTWYDADPLLQQKVLAWQGMLSAKAREQVAKAIKDGDMTTARWWLERQEKDEFSARSEHTGKDGAPIQGSWLTLIQEKPKKEDEPTNPADNHTEPTPGQDVENGKPVPDHQQGGGAGADEAQQSPEALLPKPQE